MLKDAENPIRGCHILHVHTPQARGNAPGVVRIQPAPGSVPPAHVGAEKGKQACSLSKPEIHRETHERARPCDRPRRKQRQHGASQGQDDERYGCEQAKDHPVDALNTLDSNDRAGVCFTAQPHHITHDAPLFLFVV